MSKKIEKSTKKTSQDNTDETGQTNPDENGSETSADTQEGNEADAQDVSEDKSDSQGGFREFLKLLKKAVKGGSTDDEADEDADDDADNDDDDEADDPDEADEKTFTEKEVEAIVKQRLKRKEKSMNKQFDETISALTEKLEQIAPVLDSYQKREQDGIRQSFESLPEEVRVAAPVTVNDDGTLADDADLNALRDWMPKAEKLAEKLTGRKKVKGNSGNYPSTVSNDDAEDEEARIEKARQHSIYRTF